MNMDNMKTSIISKRTCRYIATIALMGCFFISDIAWACDGWHLRPLAASEKLYLPLAGEELTDAQKRFIKAVGLMSTGAALAEGVLADVGFFRQEMRSAFNFKEAIELLGSIGDERSRERVQFLSLSIVVGRLLKDQRIARAYFGLGYRDSVVNKVMDGKGRYIDLLKSAQIVANKIGLGQDGVIKSVEQKLSIEEQRYILAMILAGRELKKARDVLNSGDSFERQGFFATPQLVAICLDGKRAWSELGVLVGEVSVARELEEKTPRLEAWVEAATGEDSLSVAKRWHFFDDNANSAWRPEWDRYIISMTLAVRAVSEGMGGLLIKDDERYMNWPPEKTQALIRDFVERSGEAGSDRREIFDQTDRLLLGQLTKTGDDARYGDIFAAISADRPGLIADNINIFGPDALRYMTAMTQVSGGIEKALDVIESEGRAAPMEDQGYALTVPMLNEFVMKYRRDDMKDMLRSTRSALSKLLKAQSPELNRKHLFLMTSLPDGERQRLRKNPQEWSAADILGYDKERLREVAINATARETRARVSPVLLNGSRDDKRAWAVVANFICRELGVPGADRELVNEIINRALITNEELTAFRDSLTPQEEKIIAQIIRGGGYNIVSSQSTLEALEVEFGGGRLSEGELMVFLAMPKEGLVERKPAIFNRIPENGGDPDRRERYLEAWDGLLDKKDFKEYQRRYAEKRLAVIKSVWRDVYRITGGSRERFANLSFEDLVKLFNVKEVPADIYIGYVGYSGSAFKYITQEWRQTVEEKLRRIGDRYAYASPEISTRVFWQCFNYEMVDFFDQDGNGPGIYMFPEQLKFYEGSGMIIRGPNIILHEFIEGAFAKAGIKDGSMVYHGDMAVIEQELLFASLLGRVEFNKAVANRRKEIESIKGYPETVKTPRHLLYMKRLEALLGNIDFASYNQAARAMWEAASPSGLNGISEGAAPEIEASI